MRRSRRQNRHGARSATAAPPPTVVGTEAVAAQNLIKNQYNFRYPKAGFCSKIEHSLLYSMLSRPDVYPASVIKDTIRNEDFSEYLLLMPAKHQTDEQEICSYAQLTAILALAAEKWPPPAATSDNSNNENDAGIAQILCKVLLQCVIRHAEEHNLDRESEVQDLLQPLERVTLQKGRQSALAAILPAYIGLGASLLAGGNPLPFWIGYAVSINAVANQERELANFRQIASTTNRMADVETTSLLTDEAED